MIEKESLWFKFNSSLSQLENPPDSVTADWVRQWFKEEFPRYGISPVQSDFCDTCSELKQQCDRARRSKQYLIDNGSSSAESIQRKEILIKSDDASLHQHKGIATREQEQYKKTVF